MIEDIIWTFISLVELSKRLDTFVQLEFFVELDDKTLTSLHNSLKERWKDIEISYIKPLVIIRLYPE